MANEYETVREVGIAIDGFRSETIGQFTTIKWLIGGLAAAGVALGGFILTKMDRLEETVAANNAILLRIEAGVNDVASNTAAIQESIQTAGMAPSPDVFPGYVGVKADTFIKDGGLATFQEIAGEGGWVYLPEQ
ncbi:hypothetical protein [Maritimibacter alexandrii]|uniref:hypothetical protein n=1 Tax=Maritimibacter alexandrii TaxID=2570355 RepID=UPI001109DDC6|nr:hypothetical protein [Maritimibacter alexandrii]